MCQATEHCGFFTFILSEQTCTLKRHGHGTRIGDDDAISGSVDVQVAPTVDGDEGDSAAASAEANGDKEPATAGSAGAGVDSDSESDNSVDAGGGGHAGDTVNRGNVAIESDASSSAEVEVAAAASSDGSPATGENPAESKRTYSSVLDQNAELNARSMLGSASAWSAADAAVGQWMQMDLGREKQVTGVITQGRSDSYESYVKEFTVETSDDGSVFTSVVTGGGQPQLFFAGPSDTRITAAFDGPVKARFLRLVVKSWEGSISMRAGAIGNAAYVPGAEWCASEGQSCTCDGTIFYGAHANLKWLMVDSPEKSQTLTCKGATFGGDPVPSVQKQCRCLPTDEAARKPHLKAHFCGKGYNKPVEKILQEEFNYMTTNANVDDDWDLIYGGYQHCGTKSHEWDMKTGLIPKITFSALKPYQQWFNCMGCRGS